MKNRQDTLDTNNSQIRLTSSSDDVQLNKWISLGTKSFKPIKQPPQTQRSEQLELPKGPLQYDRKRNMYFYGESLDKLSSVDPPESGHEVTDKEGNVIGIVFSLAGKKK